MTRLATWLVLVLVFGLLGAGAYVALRARLDAGKGLPPGSVYSRDRDGLAYAALVVRRLGYEPVAITRPIQFLPLQGDAPRLLVVADPGAADKEENLSEADVRALVRWVETGNTLLLCSRAETGLHRELGVSVSRDAIGDPAAPQDVAADEAGVYSDGVDRVAVEGGSQLHTAEPALPLWRVNNRPGAVVQRRGKGFLIVMADSSLLTRRGLRRQDNVWLLHNVVARHAGDGKVYFDEYHHGIRTGGGFWAYLRYHHQLGALLPVLLAVAVGGWAVAVRLGPAVPRPGAMRADAVDFASALSRIYQRAGARGMLARGLARDFLAVLTRHLHLRRTALSAEVLAAWRHRRPGPTGDRLEGLLRGAAELLRGDVGERRLLEWARAFDQFLKDMH